MDDDDDEEGLERLTKASKKMGAGSSSSSSSLQKARSPSPGRRQAAAAVSPSSASTLVLQPETATTTEMPFSLTGAVPQRPALLRTKAGEEPPKQRFKLKIGGASVATVAISSPTPPSTQSEAGAKDGDTG